MKKLIAIGATATLLLSGVAVFGETLNIDNTLQTMGVAAEITDGAIDWGQVLPNDVVDTATLADTQTISNTSVGYAVDVAFQVLDFTANGNTLVASWDGTPNLNEFEMAILEGITLQSNQWSPTQYTIIESGSQAVDFEITMGDDISIVDTFEGIIRVAVVEAL